MEFKEVQRFRIMWAWLGAGALSVLFIYAFVQQVIIGKPFGPKPASDLVLILLLLFFLSLMAFLRSIKMETLVNNKGIQYRLLPFQQKMILIK